MSLNHVVAITGCDSGLGWALAARLAREGLVTVAGMYNGTETEAAQALKKLRAHPHQLDVTKPESVLDFKNYVTQLLKENPNYRLYAVVNNAGTMTVGEYEWQTAQMIEDTVNVNLLGTMRVISSFLPDLRTTALKGVVKPRIINVSSHCGLQPLPSFAPYSASKAGLIALTNTLRIEQRPNGLYAVNFLPGGFIGSSNLISNQVDKFKIMAENLNEEQKRFYSKKIATLSKYLQPAALCTDYDSLQDEYIIEVFMKALKAEKPKSLYKCESWRYKIYYSLIKLPLPESIRYWLIKRFVNFPDV